MKKRVLSLTLILAVAVSLFVFVPVGTTAAIDAVAPTLPGSGPTATTGTAFDGNFILSSSDNWETAKFYAFVVTELTYGEITGTSKTLDAAAQAKIKFSWKAIAVNTLRPDGRLDLSKVTNKKGMLFVTGATENMPKDFTDAELNKFASKAVDYYAIPEAGTAADFPAVFKLLYDRVDDKAKLMGGEKGTKNEDLEPISGDFEYALSGSSNYIDLPGGGEFGLKPYAQKITIRAKGKPGTTKSFTIAAKAAGPSVKPNLITGTFPVKKGQQIALDPSDAILTIPADNSVKALKLGVENSVGGEIIDVQRDSIIYVRTGATATKPASEWTSVDLAAYASMGALTIDNFAFQSGGKLVAAGGVAIEMWNDAPAPSGQKWIAWNYAKAKDQMITKFRLKGTKTAWPGPETTKGSLSSMLGGTDILPES